MKSSPAIFENSKALYARYEKYVPAAFFVGGFLFDIVTLSQIDSIWTIGQQAAYLVFLAAVLGQVLLESGKEITHSPRWAWYFKWRMPAVHFVFGSLLSLYTLFYFKSASLASSFFFMIILGGIFVVNEWPYFQRLGYGMKFALLALCTMSYFAYVIPTLVGQTGAMVFLGSILLAMLPLILLFRLAVKRGVPMAVANKQILRPSLIVLIGFLLAYLLRIIPPVPLSIQYMGVFHEITRTEEGKYDLAFERPWWKFWQNGDQDFAAQPGDKVVIFFRLYSPMRFKDEVRLLWYLKDPKFGWVLQDRIPIKTSGGREEGFRGYAQKGNFTAGRWRVVLETSDEREIGRLGFSLAVVPPGPREYNHLLF
jgi:hypothetical protein